MKSTVLIVSLFLLTATASHAQLSLLPQLGFEQSRSTVSYDRATPMANVNGYLNASLRTAYQFKGGHSPFFTVGTAPSPVNFSLSGSPAGTGFQTAKSNLQLQLQAGYQFTSNAIQLGKATKAKTPSTNTTFYTAQKRSCGYGYRSRCGERSRRTVTKQSDPLNMRLQPALALAYRPSAPDRIVSETNGYTYNPGFKTAVVPSMGFQFAKGQQKLFTLTVFYTKPLGEQEVVVPSVNGFKGASTNISSSSSTWGLSVGVPFSLGKSTKARPKTTTEKKHCTRSYYGRCRRA